MSFEQCRHINMIMSGFDRTWFIAGGWAIDLFIGRQTRQHSDIEFAVFRRDQLHLKNFLKEWEFKKVVKGEFHTWENEYLELPIHEIHASNRVNGDKIEILLNESDKDNWIFRRDSRISYPHHSMLNMTKNGIPYLNPEIVLLYKAKNTREKDHQDFFAIKNYLDSTRKKWLRLALEIHEPEHKWIQYLI